MILIHYNYNLSIDTILLLTLEILTSEEPFHEYHKKKKQEKEKRE